MESELDNPLRKLPLAGYTKTGFRWGKQAKDDDWPNVGDSILVEGQAGYKNPSKAKLEIPEGRILMGIGRVISRSPTGEIVLDDEPGSTFYPYVYQWKPIHEVVGEWLNFKVKEYMRDKNTVEELMDVITSAFEP